MPEGIHVNTLALRTKGVQLDLRPHSRYMVGYPEATISRRVAPLRAIVGLYRM